MGGAPGQPRLPCIDALGLNDYPCLSHGKGRLKHWKVPYLDVFQGTNIEIVEVTT